MAVILVLLILGGAYKAYASYKTTTTTTQYSLARATDSSIAVTVTGSGQVASEHELSLTPKASGTLTSVTVKAGDTVRAGQVIATVDSTDAQKALRDAALNLQSAKISYQTSLTSANDTTSSSQASLDSARDSGYDAATKAETDMPTVLQDLKSRLHDLYDAQSYVDLTQQYDPSIVTTRNAMDSSYQAALSSYNATLAQYQGATRTDSPAETLSLLNSLYDTTSKVSQATASSLAFLNEVNSTLTIHNSVTKPATLATNITAVTTLSTTAQSDASSIQSAKSSLTQAQNAYSQNTQSFSGNGSLTLSVESAQLALQKAEDAYTDAQTTLGDYAVVAPFSGKIGTVSLQKFDTAGGSTAVATLITDAQFVTLSLNETDITNIQVGQPVSLTFDALPDVTATGTVAEVDQIGTVSQNVASYTVKVGFTSSDTRIKPGMTAEASITTASKDNALVVPLTAVKSRTVGTQAEYYVQVVSGMATSTTNAARTGSTTRTAFGNASTTFRGAGGFGTGTSTYASSSARTRTGASRTGTAQTVPVASVTLREVPVTIGIENDTSAEITSGLTPGMQVVTGTLNATGAATTQSKGIFSLLSGSKTTTRTGTTGTAAARTTTGTSAGASTGGFTGGVGGPPGGF